MLWAVVDLRWFWTVSKAHRFLVMNFLASNHEWVLRNLIGTSVVSQATRAIPKHWPFLWLGRHQSVGTLFQEVLEQLAEDRLSLEDFDDLTDGKSSSNISIFHLEDFGVCQSTASNAWNPLLLRIASKQLIYTYITYLFHWGMSSVKIWAETKSTSLPFFQALALESSNKDFVKLAMPSWELLQSRHSGQLPDIYLSCLCHTCKDCIQNITKVTHLQYDVHRMRQYDDIIPEWMIYSFNSYVFFDWLQAKDDWSFASVAGQHFTLLEERCALNTWISGSVEAEKTEVSHRIIVFVFEP